MESQTATQNKNDFVFNTLSDRGNWTEDVVAGLMSRAHILPTANEEKSRKMAVKFLWILNNSVRLNQPGKNWIPTESCVDLTTTGAALTRDEESMSLDEVRELWAIGDVKSRKATRHVRRHFKNCLQCGVRFLPHRKAAKFHTSRCRDRWNRANPQTQTV